MTTAATSLLGLALPVTGELSGTWGDTVNNSITSLLDTAVAGTTTLSTDSDVTLSTTTLAANQARQAIILWTANGTTTRNITAPAQSKIYTVINASAGTQSIVLRGVGPTTGVTIVKGESAVCAWNGSDFIKISNTAGAGVFSSITNTSLTSGRVVYSTTGGLETDSANLLYSGTDLTVYGITVGRGAGAVSTNTAVGASALAANTTGSLSTAVGYNAGYSITTNPALSAFGYQAGYYMTDANDAFGHQALYGSSGATGYSNAAFGYKALFSLTSGTTNTAIGRQSLYSNTTAFNNTAVGYQAAYSNTTGAQNTALGYKALYLTTTTTYNTAVGFQALYTNSSGYYNTAVGSSALYANTSGTGNIAIGMYALTSNTTGGNNVAIGGYSGGTAAPLSANTTGGSNIAIGDASLGASTTGSYNTAIGVGSLQANTTASNNTAVGYQAGYSTTTGGVNAFFGDRAGYSATTGVGNTFIGQSAGYSVTTGVQNTFIGHNTDGSAAGSNVTTGSKNTILGGYNGNQGGLDIRTSDNYIVLSDGDGNPRLVSNGNGAWGIRAAPVAWDSTYYSLDFSTGAVYGVGGGASLAGNGYYNGSNWIAKTTGAMSLFVAGSNGILTYTASSVAAGSTYGLTAGPYLNLNGTSWTNSSDERLKNITGEITGALNKVQQLRAATFTWKSDTTNKKCVGLIAQDVEKVLPEVVNSSAYVMGDETEYLGVSYTEVIPLLVAAIKELKAELDSVKAELATLKGA